MVYWIFFHNCKETKILNVLWMFKSAENLISSECIKYRLKDYCSIFNFMFILPLGAYHVYTATWGPFIFVTISWRSQVFTGINITRIRKRAVLRTFLFIKIASLQYDCVLQNTIKNHCSGWGEYYRFLLCLTAFVLELFGRSKSSHWFHTHLIFDFSFIFV